MATIHRSIGAAATVAATLAVATSAHADFLAAYDTTSAAGGQDVAVVNVSTGAQVPLPAAINTPAPELHPSLSPNGRYLALERVVAHQAGPDGPLVLEKRTVIYDLRTGADVTPANLSVPLTDPGNATPAFSPDGTHVASARYSDGPFPDGRVLITEAANPPASAGQVAVDSGMGAIPVVGCGFAIFCGIEEPKTYSPSVGSGANPLVSWTEDYIQSSSSGTGFDNTVAETAIVIRRFGSGFAPQGNAVALTGAPGQASHPSVGPLNLVAYQLGGDVAMYDFGSGQNHTTVPGVDTPLPESLPTWTPDGRYLAFLRRGTDNHQRLVRFDFGQTQQPINAGGLDLGAIPDPGAFGNLSVIEVSPPPTVFCAGGCTALSVGIPARSRLGGGTLIGLLIQRIVGTHTLFGRTVPTLVKVGRIPLGFHRRDFKVPTPLSTGGHRLTNGRYLITARTLTAQGIVKDLSVSVRHGRLHKLNGEL